MIVLMCCDSSRSRPAHIGSLMHVPYDFDRFASVSADWVQCIKLGWWKFLWGLAELFAASCVYLTVVPFPGRQALPAE